MCIKVQYLNVIEQELLRVTVSADDADQVIGYIVRGWEIVEANNRMSYKELYLNNREELDGIIKEGIALVKKYGYSISFDILQGTAQLRRDENIAYEKGKEGIVKQTGGGTGTIRAGLVGTILLFFVVVGIGSYRKVRFAE